MIAEHATYISYRFSFPPSSGSCRYPPDFSKYNCTPSMSGDNRPNADELVKQYGIDWDLKGVYNSFTGALTNVQGGTLLTISEGHSPAVVGTERFAYSEISIRHCSTLKAFLRTKHGHLFGPQGGQTWIAVTVDNPYVLLINPLENKVIQATGELDFCRIEPDSNLTCAH